MGVTLGELLRNVEAYLKKDRLSEAAELIDHALEEFPDNPDLLNAKGAILSAYGNYDLASRLYLKAMKLSTSPSPYLNNLGTAFKNLQLYKSAVDCYERALESEPASALVYHNLGLCYADAGLQMRAIAAFTKAYELDASQEIVLWGRARSYLQLGLYEHGWRDYEARLRTGQVPDRVGQLTRWDGTPYIGKRLVVLAEQGLGDTLWAMRYLRETKAMGGELIVECQGPLVSLVESLGFCDSVIRSGDPLPESDYVDYMCSLPGRFSKDLGDINGDAYVVAQDWRRRNMRSLFSGGDEKDLKVGIVWSGNTKFKRNADRAIRLETLLRAVARPGVRLFSLQKGPPEAELHQVNLCCEIENMSSHLMDFADTAAAVSELDLVVMTDSAVAHLSGALGKPIWLLLGGAPHWLWLEKTSDCPWYKSMKLFRRSRDGDWNSVLDDVGVNLMRLAAAGRR